MTRILLRLAGLLTLISALMIIGGIIVGQKMPPPRTAVFIADNGDGRSRVTLVDLRQKTVITRLTDLFTSYVDTGCHLLSSQTGGDDFWPEYVDVTDGELHFYGDAARYSRGATASWLSDHRRMWIRYYDDNGQHYEILDTVNGNIVPVELPVGTMLPVYPDWSPDSRYGVFYTMETDLEGVLLDPSTGTQTRFKVAGNSLAAWSPDSRYYASGDIETGISLLDTTTMTERQFSGTLSIYTGLIWTEDNRLIFFVQTTDTGDYQEYIWSPVEPAPQDGQLTLSSSYFPYYAPQTSTITGIWSPDTRKLFYETDAGTVIIDARTGVELARLTATASESYSVYAWSPDSRYLVGFFDFDPTIAVTDTVSGQNTLLKVETYNSWQAVYRPVWLSDSELELFQQDAATLGRIVLRDGTAEFVADYTLPGAYMAAYCDPELSA